MYYFILDKSGNLLEGLRDTSNHSKNGVFPSALSVNRQAQLRFKNFHKDGAKFLQISSKECNNI